VNIKTIVWCALLACANAIASTPEVDPYLWLEEVTGDRALAWVQDHNGVTAKELESEPGFAALQARLLSIYESNERIPYVSKEGKYYYNFWRDANNVRGVWRRTTLEEYRKPTPAWEIVLDVDALAASEKENWVWGGASCLHPTYDRCLVSFSRGGGDARVVREFDVDSKSFVVDGFQLPESKGTAVWINRDELYVARDFGPDTLTTSGYPRIVKRWQRGTELSAARTVFAAKRSDVSVGAIVDEQPGSRRELLFRAKSFYETELYLVDGKRLRRLRVPADGDVESFGEYMLVSLRTDWRVAGRHYPGGSLIAIPWQNFLRGDRRFDVLYSPTSRSSLGRVRPTRNYLLVGELDNVQSRIHTYRRENGQWLRDTLPIPEFGTVGAAPIDAFESDEYFLTVSNFVTPSTLYHGSIGNAERELLKQLPEFFDASDLQITQHEAVSKDGTRIPYFQVAKRDTPLDGTTPTLLYGYGGFEISYQPSYSGAVGSAWLERGGAYVLANIRGGGEFGPRWHQAAIKENRQRAYDDFIAVAEDLVTRKVTSPQHLGIMGGSNGGLLMGVMLTQRPDLFGAIVCQVPLLDMRRYHLLLAGASWMAEYGNPEKSSEWAYISRYSPYQNLQRDKHYPRVLFTTSTRDDRVHPGHARKMAAKMAEFGYDFLYYENTEGGHGGAANNKQQAYMNALAYAFLWKELRD